MRRIGPSNRSDEVFKFYKIALQCPVGMASRKEGLQVPSNSLCSTDFGYGTGRPYCNE